MKPSERCMLPTEPVPESWRGRQVHIESVNVVLDEQHEKLQRLERLAAPPVYVMAPHLQSEAEKAKLLRELEGSGSILLPAGAQVVAMRSPPPIPCAVEMPEPEERVLAYVPTEQPGYRWRAASWCAPPAQYDTPHWRDDASMVGDEGIDWKPEQVTHWLPMPEEPT